MNDPARYFVIIFFRPLSPLWGTLKMSLPGLAIWFSPTVVPEFSLFVSLFLFHQENSHKKPK